MGEIKLKRRYLMLFWMIVSTISVSLATSNHTGKLISGRCPSKNLRDPSQCHSSNSIDDCNSDEDCKGISKCCSDGCRNVCILPIMTSCELTRVETLKRARALQLYDEDVVLPACDSVGDFEPIQCNPKTGNCFCVDESGFEVAGTRARSIDLVNCTLPKPCAGLLCRMLCPYEFELDDDGCPLCQCRDPCRGIKCPGSQTCQLEEVPCSKEPCPPIPTCKQARRLDSMCPMGLPLTMPGSERPYLCGKEEGKPKCPLFYDCFVQLEAEYGLCCAAAEKLQKPGNCPANNVLNNTTVCGVPCLHDLECQGADKCCHDNGPCGKHCVPPHNFTLCLQQKKITELLSVNERADKGYIPQCDLNGQFETRQCSRNGQVCWCVDNLGTKQKGTMGPADTVKCDGIHNNAVARSTCDSALCAATCEYGYKTDSRGCATCECDNPCEHFTCPEGQTCSVVKDESCNGISCMPKPICRPIFISVCAFGPHLTNPTTNEFIRCHMGDKFTCPSGYHCVSSLPSNSTFCCPDKPSDNSTMSTTSSISKDDGRLPSICEIMKEISESRSMDEFGTELAIKNPRCTSQGEFEDVQCEEKECWCVDEFGMELVGSRGPSDTVTSCHRLRNDFECPGMLCRLGCDYGFTLDEKSNCPMCECRNPCDSIKCSNGQFCQMIVPPCNEAPFCPALPFCVENRRESKLKCPQGEPYLLSSTNESQICNPRGRVSTCPEGYSCYSEEDSDEGLCCPVQFPVKSGQCPFLVPVSVDTCDNECISDDDCDGTMKCCSNGCGTQCVEPLIKTACQHMQLIMKYRARESGIPANRMFIPRCRSEDGAYEPIQCDPLTRSCWCVNDDGSEVEGTRAPQSIQPVCNSPRSCPNLKCHLSCQYGFKLDNTGCPVCSCKNPCEKVDCRSKSEECRVVQVNCVRQPCPPLAVCLPRLENPCSHGHPLKDSSNSTVQCGPMGSICPSTHKCHLSPLGEFSVCCPKPRDVCFQEKQTGSCKSSVLRWAFSEKRNKCEPFRYSGCGGNMNSFDSEKDCKAVCPLLSTCEELREKNLKIAEKTKKVVFKPKCAHGTGDWEPIQCLEEVGICWCVDKDGEPIKGSLTRGTPVCGVRQARQRAVDQPICEPGVTVHVCEKSICENKICLSDPKAICRVNPCGGCSHAFYDFSGKQVDCGRGLTQCQLELQSVLNSDAWAKQGGPWNVQPLAVETLSEYHNIGRLPNIHVYFPTEEEAEYIPSTYSTTFNRFKRHQAEDTTESVTEVMADFRTDETDFFEDVTTEIPSEDLIMQLSSLADQQDPIEEHATESGIEIEGTTESVLDDEPEDPRLSEVLQSDDTAHSAQQVPDSDDSITVPAFPEEGSVQAISMDPYRNTVPALRDAIKPGFCPPVRSRTFLRVLAQFAGGEACADLCVSDADCPSSLRCCPGECGATCVDPIVLPTSLLPKSGVCPRVDFPNGCSSSENNQGNECQFDSDCPGYAKCCFDGCSSSCLRPEVSEKSTLMSVSPPICTLKGDYAREQSQGELSWCVDVNGNPIDESITRGSVRCSPNGTILEQRGLGPVCSDPAVKAVVCRNECLFAHCPAHPEAICVADPCNACQVSFVDAQGEAVECSNRCNQPVISGHCRALFPRYFFNLTSEKCEEFMYSGCEGNDNNFEYIEECQKGCEKSRNVCELPKDEGSCRADLPRWFYNTDTAQCEQFTYGGCGGNGNNFHSKKQCEGRCPDLVLCPHLQMNEEIKMCSRNLACQQNVCLGFPEAKCTVNPCTCIPTYVDDNDDFVTCNSTLHESSESRSSNSSIWSNIEIELTDEEKISIVESTEEPKFTTLNDAQFTSKTQSSITEENHHTRCEKLRKASLKLGHEFVVDCDVLGRFKPMQCMPARPGQPNARCWCVDEAGNQVVNTLLFAPGQKICKTVPVMAVAVTLGFPPIQLNNDEKILIEETVRNQVSNILNQFSAKMMEGDMEIRANNVRTTLKFTLIGDNKVEVASHLEDMVKSGHFLLDMNGHSMPADVTSSRFYHKLDSDISPESNDGTNQPALETREILAQALDIEAPYLAVIIVLSVMGCIIICGIVIGLVLYRRRTTGMYPKGSTTLASPSFRESKKSRNGSDIVPRGFPRVGIHSNQHSPLSCADLSPTTPRSKKQNRNADAW